MALRASTLPTRPSAPTSLSFFNAVTFYLHFFRPKTTELCHQVFTDMYATALHQLALSALKHMEVCGRLSVIFVPLSCLFHIVSFPLSLSTKITLWNSYWASVEMGAPDEGHWEHKANAPFAKVSKRINKRQVVHVGTLASRIHTLAMYLSYMANWSKTMPVTRQVFIINRRAALYRVKTWKRSHCLFYW